MPSSAPAPQRATVVRGSGAQPAPLPNKGKFTSKPKKKGKSPFGFVQNVAGDVADITTGIVPGVIAVGTAVGGDVAQAVEDAVRIGTGADPPQRLTKKDKPFGRTQKLAGQIKKGYVDMYGPLFRGDFDKFLDNLYEDPVYVGLDVLTVGAGATKLFVKVVPSASKAGKVVYLTTPSGKTVGKPLARGELRAQLQAAAAKTANKETKVGGRVVRQPGKAAAKVERTRLVRKDVNLRAGNQAFDVALQRNRGKPAKVAAILRGKYDRVALDQEIARLRKQALEDGPKSPAAATLKIITNPRVQKLFDQPTPKVQAVVQEARGVGKQQEALLGVAPETAEARRFLPARIASGAKWDPELEQWVGGASIDDLKARGLDPVYFPDTSTLSKQRGYGGRGGGKTEPLKTGNTKQNRGILQAAGQVVLDPAVLNDSFLKATKYQHYKDIHESLMGMAKQVDELPDGWTYVRRKRSERIPPSERMKSEFRDWADANLDKRGEYSMDDSLVTRSANDAEMVDGKYLAVPKSVAKTMTGEFTRSHSFFYWMDRNPMRVWRALVLGLRPAYLVNNAVGNTLLYLVHSARPQDLRQLAGAFKQFVKKSQHAEVDRLLNKHFAGQVRGGFVATQMPELRPARAVGRAANWTVNAIPRLDRRWEQALRRAKTKAELKRHPALKQHAERMGSENAYFEKIGPVLDDNPTIVTQVYDRVNDALGNYDHMSTVERGLIRNLFPFYAWYRAIFEVTAKLAIEQPLKTNLLARLGQVATENNLADLGMDREDVPSSLLGFETIRREGNRVRGINTSPVNPFSTVGQLAEFLAAATEGPGAMGRKLPGANPLWTDLISYIWGKTPAGYGIRDVPGAGTFDALPQARLLGALERKYGIDFPIIKPAPDGDTFNDRDVIDELLRYLGVPYARVSPSAAKRVANR